LRRHNAFRCCRCSGTPTTRTALVPFFQTRNAGTLGEGGMGRMEPDCEERRVKMVWCSRCRCSRAGHKPTQFCGPDHNTRSCGLIEGYQRRSAPDGFGEWHDFSDCADLKRVQDHRAEPSLRALIGMQMGGMTLAVRAVADTDKVPGVPPLWRKRAFALEELATV